MKAEEKKIITAFLEKTLNYSADKVAQVFVKNGDDEELVPNALDILLPDDVARIQTIKDAGKTMFDNGYKKAQGEVLSKMEADIKAKFGIDSDKQGIELIEETIAAKIPAAGKGALDDDKVKTHKVFLDREKELLKQIKDAETAGETKLKEFQDGVAKEKTFSDVSAKANTVLEGLKPILSKDPVKAANQKKLLMDELGGFSYEKNGDDIIILNKEGKRHEDQHGKPISFDTLVKETANKYWDFEQGEEHQGSGADKGAQNQGAAGAKNKWTGKLPNNDEEFTAIFNSIPENDHEQRIAFNKAVEARDAAKV